MTKLIRAEKFYLRGFNGKYIKSRTGISIQSFLKQQKAKGITYTKDDIFQYQVDYIQERHDIQDVIKAYEHIIQTYENPEKSRKGKHIHVLGCAFGDYPRVFRTILGEDVYRQLQSKCWKQKQQATVEKRYGVDNVFRKETFDTFVTPEAVADGRAKRRQTLNERYGVDEPNQHQPFAEKMQGTLVETNQERYGVDYPAQREEVAKKIAESRQRTMLKRYGAKNSVQVKEIRDKIFASRRKNKTLNSSRPEEVLGDILRDLFGEDDVLHNVIVDNRYPYHVDYYIKSRDLFIELNGDRSHGGCWFEADNPSHQQRLRAWEENAQRIESETNKRSRYRNYIRVWSQTDVAKREIAREQDLNYLVFWDGSTKTQNKTQFPRLEDVYDWISDGCPSPKEWRPENTY